MSETRLDPGEHVIDATGRKCMLDARGRWRTRTTVAYDPNVFELARMLRAEGPKTRPIGEAVEQARHLVEADPALAGGRREQEMYAS